MDKLQRNQLTSKCDEEYWMLHLIIAASSDSVAVLDFLNLSQYAYYVYVERSARRLTLRYVYVIAFFIAHVIKAWGHASLRAAMSV